MKTDAIVFSDRGNHLNFAPLSLTKPIAKLRMGILTFEERWGKMIQKHSKSKFKTYYYTEDYLQEKYTSAPSGREILVIDPLVIPTQEIVEKLLKSHREEGVFDQNGKLIGTYCTADDLPVAPDKLTKIICDNVMRIEHIWNLFQFNDAVLNIDFQLVTEGRKSAKLSKSNTVIGNQIFIEKSAKVEASVLNSTNGPIYIGENAEIMEGSLVRGGLALCEGAILKMGAKIYGAVTIGPFCKIGGEVTNSIFTGYSNKGHDGFVGNSVIGEWCNLGADTNTSNLKNNYSPVSVYSYSSEKMKKTEVQFCGLIMGDHSKSGINTMFNTATVVGVNANIFDSGFPPKYVPSYSWGGKDPKSIYDLNKAIEVAKVVCARRKIDLSEEDVAILTHLHPQSK